MTAVNRITLYSYFETGDKPTQAQFANLIDSALNLATTSAQSILSDVSALGKLDITGTLTVKSSAASLFTGNVNIGGALVVSAATTLGTTSVTGAFTVNGKTNSSPFITQVTKQIFSGNGTYTPTTGMVYCIAEAIGGGGGGGGSTGGVNPNAGAGGGGGAGGYSRRVLTAAQIGASQLVSIGAAGAAGTSGSNNGGTGGATTLGALISAGGGAGGGGSGVTNATQGGPLGGVGGVSSSGDVNVQGAPGGPGMIFGAASSALGGFGANSVFGSGGQSVRENTAGVAAYSYGGGGSGGSSNTLSEPGGAGASGLLIVTEFLSV